MIPFLGASGQTAGSGRPPRGDRHSPRKIISENDLEQVSGLPGLLRLRLWQSLAVTRGSEWACPGTTTWGRPPTRNAGIHPHLSSPLQGEGPSPRR